MPGFVIQDFGGGHRKTVESRREYYYNYFWEIDDLFEDGGDWRNNSPLICLKDCSLPTFTVNKETYQGSSLEYKFAKSVTWEDIKVSWYDSIGLLDIMKKWRNNVWSPDCGLADANHYKRQSNIVYYLPTGQSENRWRLINSWPSQIRHGDLTYTSSDVKLVEATITYDWAVENPA
jgi:hypothetical protein